MITLSLLELLYFVLIFFGVILGTLLTLILMKVLKILGVVAEITDYYYSLKKYGNYALIGMQAFMSHTEKNKEEKVKN